MVRTASFVAVEADVGDSGDCVAEDEEGNWDCAGGEAREEASKREESMEVCGRGFEAGGGGGARCRGEEMCRCRWRVGRGGMIDTGRAVPERGKEGSGATILSGSSHTVPAGRP